MKGFKKMLVCLLIGVMCMVEFAPSVEAATKKAVKVERLVKYNAKTGKITHILTGKTSSGKKVWTYKCRPSYSCELDSMSYKVKGNYVYVIDDIYFVRIRLSDGKIMNKKNHGQGNDLWDAALLVDKNGNLYAIGEYSSTVHKFTKTGKILWSTKVPSDYYWPVSMKLTGNKLRIKFWPDESDPIYYSLNAKTGKKWKK